MRFTTSSMKIILFMEKRHLQIELFDYLAEHVPQDILPVYFYLVEN